MKLKRVELRAYGPFTDAVLDFGAGESALHVVHGRNEAGKSTTLRAIRGLLFGIERRTADDHVHPYKHLRVGGVLVAVDGTELGVLRRKADKNDLLDLNGDEVVDPTRLARLLGGVDEDLFRAMYGLDHDSLRRGGEALLRGEGEIGASLMDAGLGGRGIHAVIADLEAQAEDLYAPRAQKRHLNEALRDYREAQKHLKAEEVSAEAWRAQQAAIERWRGECDRLREERRVLASERHRLQCLVAVLSPLAKRDALRSERRALGEVPDISEDAMQARAAAEQELDACGREEKRVGADLEERQRRREAIVFSEGLADVPEEVIDDLGYRLNVHRKALADRPRLVARLEQHEDEARTVLRRLGRPPSLDGAEALRVPTGLAARIRELASQGAALEAELGHARRSREEAAGRRADLERRLCARVGLERPGDTGPFDWPVPLEETVDRYATELADVERDRERIVSELDQVEDRAAEVEREIEALESAGDVPTVAQLEQARAERDRRWKDVRGKGAGDGAVGPFEEAMARADEVADRLRREAQRVAVHARLASERTGLLRAKERAHDRLEALEARAAEVDARWQKEWRPAGVVPRSPPEMRAWLRELADARASAEAERTASVRLEEQTRALDQWRADWGDAMAGLGLGPQATAAEAHAVLDELGTLFGKLQEARELRQRIAGMDRDAEALATSVRSLVQAHAADLEGAAVVAQGEALVKRWQQAQKAREERARLDEDIARKTVAQAELADRRERSQDTIRRLLAQAGCNDLDALREAEGRARRARDLEGRIAELEGQILDAGQGASLEALEGEARGREASELRARLEDIDRDLEDLEEREHASNQQLWGAEAGLDRLRERSAAESAAEAEAALARVRTHAHQYVRLRLAATLLRQELERYRERHQGPVLGRANELFPRLTLGAYRGVKAGFASNDEPVLVCVRQDGKEVGVEGLSDGTRDQLYLSLRVATFEHQARAGQVLPIVLDDVFVHFDDERARAGLEVLGELAHSAQVLFFTHHARLVELAREAVPPDRLRLHDLDALRGRTPSAVVGV